MANLDQTLKLEPRTTLGKGLAAIRHEGMVPAVIHNHGQDSVHVMGLEPELGKIYQAAGKRHPLNLQVGNDSYLALIKDVHFNPVKRRMQHMVFQAIRQDEKAEAEIPLHWEGEIPAEKIGLEVQRQLDSVQVEALPKDLPDKIIVDATKLAELGDKIIVSDLVVPAGVTILTDPEHPVATVNEVKEQVIEEVEAIPAEATEGEATTGDAANAGDNAGKDDSKEKAG